MTDNTKPDALRLADWLDTHSNGQLDYKHKVAAELRRQHAEIEALRAQVQIAKSALTNAKVSGGGAFPPSA